MYTRSQLQFFKNRNNRVTLLLIFVIIFLWNIPINTRYKPRKYLNTTDGRVYYALPRSLIKRLFTLEDKFINMTNLMKNNSDVIKTYMNDFVDNRIKPFWLPDDAKELNATLYNSIYINDTTTLGHRSPLITRTKCNNSLIIVILITSHARHSERRNIIRNTWGKDPKKDSPRWKTFFTVGRTSSINNLKKLKNEMDLHGDIIVGNINEDFYNLTFKIEMAFEWSIKYCKFDYLLKGDDDVFINMPKLFNFLDHVDTPKTSLFAGNAHYEAKVFRTGKYGVSRKEYKAKIYPRYCSGGGFILSKDVVYKMFDKFPSVPPFKIDDAYVGIVALKIGIDVFHSDDFRMWEDEKNEHKCEYNSNSILHHPVKISSCMEKLFRESLKPS